MCPAEGRKTTKKLPIASSSMFSSFTEEQGQSTESQERLATFDCFGNALQIHILNPDCSEVEIRRQLLVRGDRNVIAFQNKLVFIGEWRGVNNPVSKSVDVMDISTGQVSSLPDMIKARRL
ncbi:unnamed protein product, partial [Hymenolepis diminuta]